MRDRLPILDGWRACSILLVLAAHWVPLGPGALQLNYAAGAAGMALFFTLSGFLIVSFLWRGEDLRRFAIKRLARIVPLAWLAILTLALAGSYSWDTITRNLLFVANLPPASLMDGGHHLWSLGVEVQFYAAVGLLVLLLGQRGLWLVPVAAAAVTFARIAAGETISIVTWHRADEILAGGSLALLYLANRLPRTNLWLCAAVFAVCCHPDSGPLQYLRPYAAAALIGSSLLRAPAMVERLLVNRPMTYIAEISYALYVWHGVLQHTWLGTGDKMEVYLKRPVLFALTFLVAHLSTRHMEQPIMRWARRLRFGKSATAAV